MNPRLLLLCATALLAASAAPALAQGQMDWVEVQLALDGDGHAAVTYETRWRTSGTMHGFYFQGEAATPRFRGGEAVIRRGAGDRAAGHRHLSFRVPTRVERGSP